MDPNDSDSSGADEGEFTETNVLLGYASKIPTDDKISQLGGYPTWLDDKYPPPASLANCKICNKNMSLLLQLNGDLPEYFPGHERRIHIQACRQRQCRRKHGSIRGFRGTRISPGQGREEEIKKLQPKTRSAVEASPLPNLGSAIFGGGSAANSSNVPTNPFSTSSTTSNPFANASNSTATNPFSGSSLATKPPQPPQPSTATTDLPETFASKVRINSQPPQAFQSAEPSTPWPSQSSFPPPYPTYHLDADYETLSAENPSNIPASARIDNEFDTPESGTSGSSKEDKEAFESTLDKTFQKFADRLAQNPEQVLRYEFRGQPLLYNKSDPVGKLLAPYQTHSTVSDAKVQSRGTPGTSGMPRCENCGTERLFEVQLTPQAIAELEAEETGLEGMDWGTVILGVCGKDCMPKATKVEEGEVGWLEEWVGVQWEEVVEKRGK
ncbi:hypothetical protein EV356DRAFT_462198 [Viridothelium virens]|uniref:Programmed cell death protein 2 C-terminal domain-containing protein n=1 Tax=Viridothelium virens TaxID=1048519 RepID=A0A6A6HHM0_VIRVR|nr:hypothetical protein EV356DRAFT_462198 [Viridothelium virens]